MFRSAFSPEEVGSVVHDAVVIVGEIGVGRLRGPLVEVAPFACVTIDIKIEINACQSDLLAAEFPFVALPCKIGPFAQGQN